MLSRKALNIVSMTAILAGFFFLFGAAVASDLDIISWPRLIIDLLVGLALLGTGTIVGGVANA